MIHNKYIMGILWA